MLTDREKDIIQRTWRRIVPIRETAADLFYERLFQLKPSYRALFKGDLTMQKRKFVTMLAFVVRSLDWRQSQWQEVIPEDDDLFLVVLAMGRRHTELYRVPDEAYGVFGQALLWTLDHGLKDAFDDDARSAWTHAYILLANTMRIGQGATELGQAIEPMPWAEMER